jgi:tetratricopeptide (TPR) repeat protein
VSKDWFRNATWNSDIEAAFNQKLRRARRKEQYLRIQASTLAKTHPEVALRLLDQYFELPDDFDHAQGHVDRATAFLALGRIDDAMDAYEDALARERVFPKLKTEAYLELPFQVAVRQLRHRYQRALELLQENQKRLMFPVDHFRWNASLALIAADSGRSENARAHAREAMEAAGRDDSGFRYHPSVGLVGDRYDEVIEKLESHVAGGASRLKCTI